MPHGSLRGYSLCLLAVVQLCAGAAKPEQKLDKERITQYIRYAEGFGPGIRIDIDDPVESSFTGLRRLLVHLSTSRGKTDRVYYVTSDGDRLVNGNIWDLKASPFVDVLERLPKTGPAFGPADAKVTIVIFSDFECPYCRAYAKVVRDNVARSYPRDVRVVFEDFPIESIHPWAEAAAEAGACINEQKPDSFWAYHDWIFEHQGEIKKEDLRAKVLEFAGTAGLESAKLSSCLDSHAKAGQVAKSLETGRSLQIDATPTSFVNGRTLPGAVGWPDLDAAIRLELEHSGKGQERSDKSSPATGLR